MQTTKDLLSAENSSQCQQSPTIGQTCISSLDSHRSSEILNNVKFDIGYVFILTY